MSQLWGQCYTFQGFRAPLPSYLGVLTLRISHTVPGAACPELLACTQRAQCGLIKEHTLSRIRDPYVIQVVNFLVKLYLVLWVTGHLARLHVLWWKGGGGFRLGLGPEASKWDLLRAIGSARESCRAFGPLPGFL